MSSIDEPLEVERSAAVKAPSGGFPLISSDELTSLLDRLCVRKITFAGSDCLQLVLRRSDEDRPVGYYKIDSFDFFLFRMLHHRDKGQKKVDWAAQGF